MSEITKVDDIALCIDDEGIVVDDITFERSDESSSDGEYREAMVTSYEIETSVEGELSFEDEDEFAQCLIDMGYTVVREYDGSIIAVADEIEVVNDDVSRPDGKDDQTVGEQSGDSHP